MESNLTELFNRQHNTFDSVFLLKVQNYWAKACKNSQFSTNMSTLIEALIKQNACLERIVSLIECCKKTLRNVSWSGRKINQQNSRLNNRQKIRNVRIVMLAFFWPNNLFISQLTSSKFVFEFNCFQVRV